MPMEFWVTSIFNGISYGALLFLLAGGLSLIFGMMRIVNMTHGSYYLLGAYVALSTVQVCQLDVAYAVACIRAVTAPHWARPCGESYGMPCTISNVPRLA